jgi:hypothetical protein
MQLALEMRTLKTAADVIDFFGGNKAVAEQISGLSQSAVAMWRHRNEIPRAYFPHFQISLASYRHQAGPQVFGLTSWKPIRLRKLSGSKAKARKRAS